MALKDILRMKLNNLKYDANPLSAGIVMADDVSATSEATKKYVKRNSNRAKAGLIIPRIRRMRRATVLGKTRQFRI